MINEEFVLKGESKDRVIVFDLDDTLVKTDAKIKVIYATVPKIFLPHIESPAESPSRPLRNSRPREGAQPKEIRVLYH